MTLEAANPFMMVGQLSAWSTTCKKNDWTYTITKKEVQKCPQCGGIGIYYYQSSETWTGGDMEDSFTCRQCNFCEGDGDGWSSERYEPEPRGYFTNNDLCHNCQEVYTNGTILCPECEETIYGPEAAQRMRIERLPYRLAPAHLQEARV